MFAGGVADLTVFGGDEGRLSDMLVEFDSPVLNNAVTQYLATDEDDTEMEGRLKNVLEGMIIGGPLEILFGVKAFKKATKAKTAAEKVNKEWKNLDEWWRKSEVQYARKKFCEQYARTSHIWLWYWVKALWRI